MDWAAIDEGHLGAELAIGGRYRVREKTAAVRTTDPEIKMDAGWLHEYFPFGVNTRANSPIPDIGSPAGSPAAKSLILREWRREGDSNPR